MTGLTIAKYALALSGVAIVLAADRYGRPELGWIGLGLILSAFFLRFWRREKGHSRNGSEREP
jgi:hypothetical protein